MTTTKEKYSTSGREMDTPLSQSNVSHKLSLIRKRCEELLEEDQFELSLEDAEPGALSAGAYNPYDHG